MDDQINETKWLELENASGTLNKGLVQELGSDWGPKRDPLYVVIPITFLYIIIFITGVLGNISTCIVISRNKAMHTATNYYLFSLAISDLLLLVSGLPPEIYSIWSKYPYVFGEAFCVMQGFAAETSANATVLTITAFTVERYVAICHPFLSHTMSKLSRAIKFVIAVWILAMCLAIPQAMSFGIVYEHSSQGKIVTEHYVCIVKRIVIPHAFEISTFLFFVAPMSMITVLYILIGLQLHRSTVGPSRGNSVKLKHRIYKPVVAYTPSSTQAVLVVGDGDVQEKVQLTRQEDEGRKNFARNAQATKHVVKMLVAVVVAFFICWAPFHAQRLLAIYGQPDSNNMVTAFRILTYISGVLYFLSTSVNPFLYHIMSHKFREAFKDTFKGFFGRTRPKGNRCYSTLSGRSSQINSHSNTDSCSRQSSLRYLEAEMARLHDSKRPLVVSFRRKRSQYPKRPKQVTILDAELQEALDNLKEEPKRREIFEKMCFSNKTKFELPIYEGSENVNEFSYVEVHSLQPTHICPNGKKSPYLQSTAKLEDIEIFREQRLSLNDVKKGKLRSRLCKAQLDPTNQFLTKSCTMPQMRIEQQLCNELNSTNGTPERFFTWKSDENVRVDERSNSCSQLECFKTKHANADSNIVIQVT